MGTLATGGRISLGIVDDEIARLTRKWTAAAAGDGDSCLRELLGAEAIDRLDLFDRAQLAEVIRVCRASRSLSDAGRRLFAVSRQSRERPNDADRLRKYLARFGLDWRQLLKPSDPTAAVALEM